MTSFISSISKLPESMQYYFQQKLVPKSLTDVVDEIHSLQKSVNTTTVKLSDSLANYYVKSNSLLDMINNNLETIGLEFIDFVSKYNDKTYNTPIYSNTSELSKLSKVTTSDSFKSVDADKSNDANYTDLLVSMKNDIETIGLELIDYLDSTKLKSKKVNKSVNSSKFQNVNLPLEVQNNMLLQSINNNLETVGMEIMSGLNYDRLRLTTDNAKQSLNNRGVGLSKEMRLMSVSIVSGITESMKIAELLKPINYISDNIANIYVLLDDLLKLESAANRSETANDAIRSFENDRNELERREVENRQTSILSSLLDAIKSGTLSVIDKTKNAMRYGIQLPTLRMPDIHMPHIEIPKFSLGDSFTDMYAKLFDKKRSRRDQNIAEILKELESVKYEKIVKGLESVESILEKIEQHDKASKVMDSISRGLSGMQLPDGKRLIGVALGLSAIGLSIGLVIHNLELGDIGKFLVLLGGIAGAMWLFDKADTNKSMKDTAIAVAILAGGMYVLGHAIHVWDNIKLESIAKASLAIGLIGVVTYGLHKANITPKQASVLGILGVGMIAIALGVASFELVTYDMIAKAGVAMATVGLIAFAMDKAKIGIKDALVLGLLGVGMMSVAYGVQMFENVTIEQVGVAALAVGGIGMIISLIGTNGVMPILLGALGLAGIGAGLVVLSYGLGKILEMKMSWEDVGIVAGVIGATGTAFALIGIPAVAGLVLLGAAAVGAMSLALIGLGAGLNAVNSVSLDENSVTRFSSSIGMIKGMFVSLGDGGGLISLAAGMAQAGMLSIATLSLAAGMFALSKLDMPSETKIDLFGFAISGLKDAYTQFGVIDSAKLLLATPIMLAMAGTSVAIGGAIALFSKISPDKKDVDKSIQSVDMFVSGIAEVFKKYDASELEKIHTGVRSLFGVNKLMHDIAKGVRDMSQLRFSDYEVINGKMVLKGVTELKPEDFEAYGQSIGMMIDALVDPLVKVSEQKDKFSLGGFEITNPFSNKVKSGIKALSGLSGVFMPLVEMVKIYDDKKIDKEYVDRFKSNTGIILSSVSDMFMNNELTKDTTAIRNMNEMTNTYLRFMNALDDKNLIKGAGGLAQIANSVKLVKEQLNNVDLDHLMKMNDVLLTINTIVENQQLDDLTEVLRQLAETLQSMQPQPAPVAQAPTIITVDKTPNGVTPAKQEEQQSVAQIIVDSNTEIIEQLSSIVETLNSGSLRVKISNVQS